MQKLTNKRPKTELKCPWDGGHAIPEVAALEQGGLRAAAIDGVIAAWRRNQELGK